MAKAKITFWSEVPKEEYFVVKQKRGNEDFTPIDVLHDHLSNSVYQLFGVCTPNFYIGNYHKRLSLISNIMPGYKDLVEWLKGGEEALGEINKHQKLEDCVDAYKQSESGLSISGKENLLAAAIILEDTDVIGAGLRNLGLVKSASKHKIIKIDPSNSIFEIRAENIEDAIRSFESNLSLDNPLIYKPFTISRIFNNPKSILGNLHLCEFFHDIDKQKVLNELAKFAYLDEKHIRNLVLRDDYFELLSIDKKNPYLEQLCNILLKKQAVLRKALHLEEIKYNPPEPAPVFIGDIELSDPVERIMHGASAPFKVKRIQASDKSTSGAEAQVHEPFSTMG